VVAVVRSAVFPVRIAPPGARVVEPEIDMDRLNPRESAPSILRDLIRKLLPATHRLVRPPMRSVAREIEEFWPSREF